MTFVRAWVLIFTLAPLAWAWLEWQRSGRKLALGLKTACLVLVICALSEPRVNYNDTKVAVAALVDTSASVSPPICPRLRLVRAYGEEARLERSASDPVCPYDAQPNAFRKCRRMENDPYGR